MKHILFYTLGWFISRFEPLPTLYMLIFKKGGDLSYLSKVAHGYDQLGAAVFYKNDDTDISGNIGYKIKKGIKLNTLEKIIGVALEEIDKGHLAGAIEKDEKYS